MRIFLKTGVQMAPLILNRWREKNFFKNTLAFSLPSYNKWRVYFPVVNLFKKANEITPRICAKCRKCNFLKIFLKKYPPIFAFSVLTSEGNFSWCKTLQKQTGFHSQICAQSRKLEILKFFLKKGGAFRGCNS